MGQDISRSLGTHEFHRNDGHVFSTNGSSDTSWIIMYGTADVLVEVDDSTSILTLTFPGPDFSDYVFLYNVVSNTLDTSRSGGMTGGVEIHTDHTTTLTISQSTEIIPNAVDLEWRVLIDRNFIDFITVSVSIKPLISQTTASPN